MLDPSQLYPSSFNPVFIDKSVDLRTSAKHLSRRQASPKYYLVDFGLSRRYSAQERPPSEPIILGADKSPPEHRHPALVCDPFPTDIYYLGNMVKSDLLQVTTTLSGRRAASTYFSSQNLKRLDFLQGLVDSMIQEDPLARPTAAEVVESFHKIQEGITHRERNARLPKRDERGLWGLIRDVIHAWREYLSRSSRSPSPRAVNQD
jgi:hypothetical protein